VRPSGSRPLCARSGRPRRVAQPARPPRADGSPYAAGATLPAPPPVAAPGLLGLEGGRPYRFPALGIGLGAAGFACLLATAALLCWWCRARSRARVAAPCCSHKLSGDSLEPGLSVGSTPHKARPPPARPPALGSLRLAPTQHAPAACPQRGGGSGPLPEQGAGWAGAGAERVRARQDPESPSGLGKGGAPAERAPSGLGRVSLSQVVSRVGPAATRASQARPPCRTAAPAAVGAGGRAGVRFGPAPARRHSRGRSRRGCYALARR